MLVSVAALLGLLATAAFTAPNAATAHDLQSSRQLAPRVPGLETRGHLVVGAKSRRNVPGPLMEKPPLTTRDILAGTQLEARQSGKLGRRAGSGVGAGLAALAQKFGGKTGGKPGGSATPPLLEGKPDATKPNPLDNTVNPDSPFERARRRRKMQRYVGGALVAGGVIATPFAIACEKGKLGCDDEKTRDRKAYQEQAQRKKDYIADLEASAPPGNKQWADAIANAKPPGLDVDTVQ